MAATVAHRPLAPNCKPIGLLWPAGDWVSRATSPRFMAETVAPRAPLGPNATRSVVFCSAHKAGHTLGVSLAARLRPFVPNAHFFEECSERNLRAACASGSFLVVIERDIFSMVGSGVLYHASGAEPWTRCRLHPCNQTIDASCCFSCGECILGTNRCNCSQLTPSCAAFTRPTWRMGAALAGLPTGVEAFYESKGVPWALPVARNAFESIARPLHARYPHGAVLSEHLHLLYRRGLAATRWEPTVEWADPAARTAAVAAELLRFLISELPRTAPLHAALPRYSACSLRLCLSQFTASSELFATSSRLILERARVPRHNWPAAMAALARADVSAHPSDHSTARIVPSAARAELEAEARRLDEELLDGLLRRQGYGSGCASL